MTLVDTLDVLPKNQPDRDKLIHILRALIADLARYQDPQTGLWYEVISRMATRSKRCIVCILRLAVTAHHANAKRAQVFASISNPGERYCYCLCIGIQA